MRRKQSQSIVFLTELFLALTIYALCASVCAGLFSWSHRLNGMSSDLTHGVIAAQSGAEAFKKYSRAEALADVLGGSAGEGLCTVYYGADWKTVAREDAVYFMQITLEQDATLRYAQIVVADAREEIIFRLESSALAEVGR